MSVNLPLFAKDALEMDVVAVYFLRCFSLNFTKVKFTIFAEWFLFVCPVLGHGADILYGQDLRLAQVFREVQADHIEEGIQHFG